MGTIAQDIAEAWRFHQAGHLQEALRRYEVILQTAPNRPMFGTCVALPATCSATSRRR